MLVCKYYLLDGVTRLSGIVKSKSLGIEVLQERVLDITRNMLLAAEELLVTLDSWSIISIKEAIHNARQNVLDTKTPEELEILVNRLVRDLNNSVQYNDGTTRDFSYNVRRQIVKECDQEKALEADFFKDLVNLIDVPDREISLLDPLLSNCFSTVNLKAQFSQAKTYGITAHENYSGYINTNIDRVAVGKGEKARISNDAFDVMYIEPASTWDLRMDNAKQVLSTKTEKIALTTNFKYVREDGLVIIVMPYYKLYDDVCATLARNLRDVRLFRMGTSVQNAMANIIIIGYRKPHNNKKLNDDLFEALKANTLDYNNMPFVSELKEKLFVLPRLATPIETFRGSIINQNEAKELCETTGLLTDFLNQEKHVESSSDKNPLLPFNIGQIGLVLTSGCLDGIIDEGDDNYHVIKGRVKKDIVREQEMVGDNQIEINETFQNKVEISIMMGNGEYKILA